eukprot:TRINITY_DN11970_c0_g3_i1.p1 TRINITY_DN11970_c0_g3~~TRINITY_DN11970_c0_g3_i1.p1  ORF type:complete len:565 (+),score=175.82 TRINITY_DN11970_c0_g3_i1:129-1697(+)
MAQYIDPGQIDQKLSVPDRLGRPLGRRITDLREDYELVVDPKDDPRTPGMLGAGTYGRVWRYRRVTRAPIPFPEGPVAIKELDKRKACSSAKSLKHIMVEIAVLKNLRHPNIVCCFEVMFTDTRLYLVMEYCQGGELYHFIASQRLLQPKTAAIILKQIMMGLEYMHREMVVHRDIKPENILINKETLHIKLIDFGLAKYCGSGGPGAAADFPVTPSPGTVGAMPPHSGGAGDVLPSPMVACTPCGTELYSSLESISGILDNQCGRRPWMTTRSRLSKLDVYGAGVIAYAMLTGKLPFRSTYRNTGRPQDRERRLADLRAKMQQGLQFPPSAASLPLEAMQCVRAMMDHDIDRRVSARQTMELSWLKDVEVPASARLLPPGADPKAVAEPAADVKVLAKADPGGISLGAVPKPKRGGKRQPSKSPPASHGAEGTGEEAMQMDSSGTGASPASATPESEVVRKGAIPAEAQDMICQEEEDPDDPGTADPARFRNGWAELMGRVRGDEDDDLEVKTAAGESVSE